METKLLLALVLASVSMAVSWKQVNTTGPAPNPRMDHTLGTMQDDNTIVLFGGWSGSGQFLNDTWMLDFSNEQRLFWNKFTTKNLVSTNSRADHTLSVLDPSGNYGAQLLVWAGGGYPHDILYNSLISLDIDTATWKNVSATNAPPAMMGQCSVLTPNGLLVSFGGDTNDGTTNGVYVYNLRTGAWSQINFSGEQPKPRLWHTCVLMGNDTMYLFGGKDEESGNCFGDTWALDLSHWNWTQLSNTGPSKRSGHVAVMYKDAMYVFAGQGNTGLQMYNDLWAFNTTTSQWNQMQPTGALPQPIVGGKGTLYHTSQFAVWSGCTNNSEVNGCTAFTPNLWQIDLSQFN